MARITPYMDASFKISGTNRVVKWGSDSHGWGDLSPQPKSLTPQPPLPQGEGEQSQIYLAKTGKNDNRLKRRHEDTAG